jgi:O-6-methylguanine DNA methyltransferase
MELFRARFDTPVGPMMALASDAALCALEFWMPGRMGRLDARLERYFAPCPIEDVASHPILDRTGAWLDDYFQRGTLDGDLPLDPRGAPFELRVWQALRTIPRGETRSYGEIARQIGAATASRAVGMANGANPLAIVIPCHRVIGTDGRLTGYGGGLDRKRWLLEHERALGSRLWAPGASCPP